MSDTLPISEVLDRLDAGPWRVAGLPTLRGEGLYLVAQQGRYFWFDVNERSKSVSRYRAMDREQTHAFLARYTPPAGYPSELLVRWTGDDAKAIRAALDRTEELYARLLAEPAGCVRVMKTWWGWRSPWFGWLLCTPQEGRAPRMFASNDTRICSEIMSMALADPEHDLEEAIAEVAAHRADLEARADELFEAHGPTRDRILWMATRDDRREGMMLDPHGHYGRVEVAGDDAAPELLSYCKYPTDKARERIFEAFDRERLTLGSLVVPPSMRAKVDGAADPSTLAQWLSRSEVVIGCGEFRPDSWIADSPTTLLDTYKGTSLPVQEALAPCLGDEGWIDVRFTRLVSLSEVARAKDDPEAPSVRYTVPKGWAYRVDRERLIEHALEAVVRAATGNEEPLTRSEEKVGDDREREEPGRERARQVTLGDESRGVVLFCSPIESGHGVHGEYVNITFHGLPASLRISGSARLDMRSGGELSLDIEGPQKEAMLIKRACLDALP